MCSCCFPWHEQLHHARACATAVTTLVGAVLNIVLDPIFIFVLDWGVKGAATATVISQAVSALWVMQFLTGKRAQLRLRWENLKLNAQRTGRILTLGFSGFVMAFTNSAVQVVCNSVLSSYGGDLYVGVMTVLSSIREVVSMPVQGLTGAAEPVLGFNYGARKMQRCARVFGLSPCARWPIPCWCGGSFGGCPGR